MKVFQTQKVTHSKPVSKQWKSEKFVPLEDVKFRILLDDGNIIEAGVFVMGLGDRVEYHACVSSQVGCKFGCRMCSSGKNGFSRNLTDQEILSQIKLLEDGVGVTQLDEILFMGIGEPLDNYDNFVSSLKKLSHYSGKLSFATVGLPNKLLKISQEELPRLKMVWISLHASDDAKRLLIMPVNRYYKIADILNSAKEFALATGVRVWINYLLFEGFNDSDQDAESFVRIMDNTESYFRVQISAPNNDIPEYRAATNLQLECFEKKLKEFGLRNDTFRFEAAGKDVQAGCGEFVYLAN